MLKGGLILICLIFVLLCGQGWGLIFIALGALVVRFILTMYGEFAGNIVIGLDMGGDALSLGLTLLSLWIVILIIMGSVRALEGKGHQYFRVLIILIAVLLIGVFLRIDLFIFYLFFERVLIPTYILIMG